MRELTAAERARLLQKGKRLYGRCLAREDAACVTGFVDHQRRQGPARRPLLHAYRAWLAAQNTAPQVTQQLIAYVDQALAEDAAEL